MRSGLTERSFQSFNFRREDAAPQRRQSVIPPPGIICAGSLSRFRNQTLKRQSLQVVIERAGTEPIPSARLASYFLNDSVAVKFVARKRYENME